MPSPLKHKAEEQSGKSDKRPRVDAKEKEEKSKKEDVNEDEDNDDKMQDDEKQHDKETEQKAKEKGKIEVPCADTKVSLLLHRHLAL